MPPAALTGSGMILPPSGPRPSDIARVQGWVTGHGCGDQPAALAPELLNRQAALLNLREIRRGHRRYARLLTLNARDAVAMNNLGFLLAATRKNHNRLRLARQRRRSSSLPSYSTRKPWSTWQGEAEPSEDGKRAAAGPQTLLSDVEVQARVPWPTPRPARRAPATTKRRKPGRPRGSWPWPTSTRSSGRTLTPSARNSAGEAGCGVFAGRRPTMPAISIESRGRGSPIIPVVRMLSEDRRTWS